MTMERLYPDDQTDSRAGRSVTMSATELWQEILSRLNDVQADKITLAQAVEDLGMIIRDQFSEETKSDLEPSRQGAVAMASVTLVPSELASQESVQGVSETEVPSETAQAVVDALLGIDLSDAGRPEPETTPVVTSTVTEQQRPGQGSSPDEAPTTIADLSSEAIDSLLVTEFGEMTGDVTILDALLGDVFVPASTPAAAPPAPDAAPAAVAPAVEAPVTDAPSAVAAPAETPPAISSTVASAATVQPPMPTGGPTAFDTSPTFSPIEAHSKEPQSKEPQSKEPQSIVPPMPSDVAAPAPTHAEPSVLPAFSPGQAPAPEVAPRAEAAPAPEPAVVEFPEPELTGLEPAASPRFMSSAASMATEILAANPNDTKAEPEGDEDEPSQNISEDFTFIAKGRRRRFRVR